MAHDFFVTRFGPTPTRERTAEELRDLMCERLAEQVADLVLPTGAVFLLDGFSAEQLLAVRGFVQSFDVVKFG